MSQNSGSGHPLATILMSLLVVIGVIFALAYMMRRFNLHQGGQGQLKPVASMMLGSKERLMVVQVGDEQHLLGITAHQVNHLAKLDTPITDATGTEAQAGFAQLFKRQLAAGKGNGVVS